MTKHQSLSLLPSRQPSPVKTEVLEDVAHQHHVLFNIQSPIASTRRQVKDRPRCFLGRRHRDDRRWGIFDQLHEEVEIYILLAGESGCVDVVLAEIERYDQREEGFVVEWVFTSEDNLRYLLDFYLVGLDNLRDKSLSLGDLHLHLFVVVDLHKDHLQLVVDQLGKSLSCTIVDVEWRRRRRRRDYRLVFMQWTKILLEEAEVILIWDEAVSVEIHFVEELLVDLLRSLHIDCVERVLHRFDKLWQIHNPLGTIGVDLLPVQSLYCHLSEVLLHTEINLPNNTLTNSLKVTLRSLSLSYRKTFCST